MYNPGYGIQSHDPRFVIPDHFVVDVGVHQSLFDPCHHRPQFVDRYKSNHDESLLGQIANLRYRVYLIRNMQIAGVLSLLFCVISMFALFAGWILTGQWSFAVALVLLLVSLGISLRELQISVGALDLLLTDLEEQEKNA